LTRPIVRDSAWGPESDGSASPHVAAGAIFCQRPLQVCVRELLTRFVRKTHAYMHHYRSIWCDGGCCRIAIDEPEL